MNNEIKAALILAGVKQSRLADSLGVSRALVSLVVSGKKKSSRVRQAIARALGLKVEDLWPAGGTKKAA